MNSHEENLKRRRVERIGRERLPECLHSLEMMFASGDRIPVETFDASTLGLGLNVPRSAEVMTQDMGVLLQPNEEDFKLIGEVVFIIPMGPDACRVGVQFTQTIAIEKYLELLP